MSAPLLRKLPPWLKLWFFKNINLWPPFFGAGIKIEEISKDYLKIVSAMNLRWYNRNYVNTHFGGSLYAMTDPFYMLMIMQHLGPKYIVWDIAARIRFKAPGKGKVTATFLLTLAEIENIKALAATQEKVILKKTVDVVDELGVVVARIRKAVYIRRKTT